MQGDPTRTGPSRRTGAALGAVPSRDELLMSLRRTPLSVWNEDVTDWAAALTYYAVLALIPLLLVTVSLTGIADASQTGSLIERAAGLVPPQARPVLEGALRGTAGRHSEAWAVALVGSLGSLWSASSYLAVFRRALHAMHGVKDRRSAWRTVPRVVAMACALLVALVSSALVLTLSGDFAAALLGALGLGGAAAATWDVLKWPLLLCLAATMVLVLFRSGPAPARGGLQRVLGGGLAVVLWLTASVAFAAYTAHVGTYDRLYGPLAGFIVFLVWLWVSNLALLTGAQFNAELARARARARARWPGQVRSGSGSAGVGVHAPSHCAGGSGERGAK
ncbi:YihY/virulence factor BrkB family protein [Streptomyces sp. FIT100]|uniref:YihY/virulence factor BrkB family protein n=1 Tax=Streptomyces sp. FIT100 TaxID=2837956 RepID=UPI0021C99F34|nr:YihY/virulence factor BrkB family protein [Streptomyces sp. FIT100]UUN25285.1 YihY/virulence factor BrkB family protein [Streptomyces sp. FIT100]